MDRSRLRTLFGFMIGYVAYAVCVLSLLAGGYVGIWWNAPVGMLFFGGLAVLSFATGKTTFHLTRHPNWAIDLSETDDSISYRRPD